MSSEIDSERILADSGLLADELIDSTSIDELDDLSFRTYEMWLSTLCAL